MKLKIVSEGTPLTTTIVDAETGDVLDNVLEFTLSMKAGEPFGTATVVIAAPNIDVTADFSRQ